MENKYFLGIYHGHNSTAALVREDGVLTDCVSEERFRGVKNFEGFPTEVIKYFNDKYPNLKIERVGLPFEFMNSAFLMNTSGESKKSVNVGKVLSEVRSVLLKLDRELYDFLYALYSLTIARIYAEKQRKTTSKYLNLKDLQVSCYNHQLCHAYTAYYLSPYNNQDSLVLTLDGEGDMLCATVNTVKNGKLETLAKTPLSSSLGWIYADVTKYLGMKPLEHEYKVMGLAPYAKAEHVDVVYQIIQDWVAVDGMVFKSKFDTHRSFEFMMKSLQRYRFDNIAGAFQRLVEEKVLEWVANCIKETNLRTICCAGGVFMNVKLNMKISQLNEVHKLWVMPSCSDESVCIGAAIASYRDYCLENKNDPIIQSLKDLYLGPQFSNEDIKKFINENNLGHHYTVLYDPDIEKRIAGLLAEGNVVANMSGRMEFGARALGNRSILADASKPDVIREINEYIKNRDFWMPFAGSILEERVDEYIVNPKKVVSDYMIMSFESTSKAIKELRAAMHPYDFTIRPQVVNKEFNPRYHKIIKEFEKITGVGGILNTSFNLHGYPIVLGPKEALFVFQNSGIKFLVLENYIIIKN